MIDFLHNNLQYLLSGISVGGQYALIAIGYTMVYGILRLINFAHGDVFMVAGLIMIYAIAGGLPMWAAIVLVIVLTVALGVAIEKVAYKPLRSAPRMSVMISAIGVSYLLQNCALYFTGGLPRTYPVIPFLTKKVTIWGATTKMVTVVTPILTIVLIVVLVLLIKYTKIGMAMRAVSKDFETSQLMGIKINSVISFTFVIGCFLAAVGSLLYFSNYQTVVPTSGATQLASDTPTGSAPRSNRPRTYTVQSGDSLYSIARRFNVEVKQLRAWNGVDTLLKPGQQLTLHLP